MSGATVSAPTPACSTTASSASVMPAIADTTTTLGSARWLRMISTAWRNAVASASAAPPNLCTWGARRDRGIAAGNITNFLTMLALLKLVQSIIKTLHSEGTPGQVAAGIALGAALGLTPLVNAHN